MDVLPKTLVQNIITAKFASFKYVPQPTPTIFCLLFCLYPFLCILLTNMMFSLRNSFIGLLVLCGFKIIMIRHHCQGFITVTGSSLSLVHHCHWCITVTDASLSLILHCHGFVTVTDSSLSLIHHWFNDSSLSLVRYHCQWFFTVTGSLSLSMILPY